MSTILAYTSPAIGHLFPMTPTLLELQRRGHTVHLRTMSSQIELMNSFGFHTEPIDPRIEQIRHNDHHAKNSRDGLSRTSKVFTERGDFDAPDLRHAFDQVRPDVTIVDINAWGAASMAEALGTRWITFSPYTPPLDSPGTPPFGPGLAPMRGPIGRVRDAIVRRTVLGVVERAQLQPLNALRSRLGIAPVATADEFFRKAPRMLVATAKPFEYASTDWGPDVVMIGACAWEPRSEPPEWLADIDRPIVLVTTSSEYQDDTILVRTAIEALADQSVHLVATVPASAINTIPAAPNVTVVEFVPHSHVLERAAAAITHAGMGATQKALAHGVPVIAVPFGRDQFEVARRVEVSDSGTRLPAIKLTRDRLATAVDAAITKTAGAKQVAHGYTVTGGATTAANTIEQHLT